jgi:signal transduction histidine kinase/CheY-like chemotaxis protein
VSASDTDTSEPAPDKPLTAILSAASALARDRFVQLQAAALVLVGAFYVLPVASDAMIAAFSWTWVCVPFMVWPVVGCFAGLSRVTRAADRRFWTLVGFALVAWLLALLVYALVPEDTWTLTTAAVMDLLYLVFYALLYIAIDRRPDAAHGETRGPVERRLRTAGVSAFGVGWTLYFVIVPTWLGSYGMWPTVSETLMFVLLDSGLMIRACVAWRDAATPYWRRIYALLAVATLVLLGTDSLGLLDDANINLFLFGSPFDLLWALPGTAYVIAVRARELPGAEVMAPPRAVDELSLARVGSLLLVGALSFPTLHAVFDAVGVLPARGLPLHHGLVVVMFASTGVLAGMAIVAYGWIARDVLRVQSERRALEAQLVQAQKMEAIGRMAGGVAHDFNNLLTAIAGYNDMVLEHLPSWDDSRPMLEEVRAATNKAASLVRQLLTFSRRQAMAVEPLDLNRVVVNAQNMMRRLIGEDVRLELDLAPDLGAALASENQFEQVVLNLVVNARDAMPRGGRITIATRAVDLDDVAVRPHAWLKPGRFAAVSVSDTGVGIPADVLPHIFDPFFTTKERDKGTGLGLAMVYGTMRQFGGAVDVQTHVGRGTTFRLLLPMADSEERRDAAQAADAPGENGSETVLLAEDDEHVRSLVRKILKSRGYDVIEGDTAFHAAELAESHPGPIHLLLTDVVMPELNGPELAVRTRRTRTNLPVLFMSGYTDNAYGPNQGVFESGDFIQKPFTPPALARAVRRAIDREADQRTKGEHVE